MNRKEHFDTIMIELDEQIKSLPKLESKFIGITMPFPQLNEQRKNIILSIRNLKESDKNVCIAVTYDQLEETCIDYKKIIFIGNDYFHLLQIINFMKSQEIELSIRDICVLYREFSDDLNSKLIGNHSRITSANDLFSMAEIQIESIGVGMGYIYENKQVDQDIIYYCCHKDDEEGKVLGYQLFKKSLEYYSKKLLTQGFLLGYPVEDSKINLIKSYCNMCSYRDYYYLMGAQMALKKAMTKARWQLCEPLMEVNLICTKSYVDTFGFFKGIEYLDIIFEKETCFLVFKSRITRIIGCIDEFYNNKEVLEFNMKLDSYVGICNGVNLNNKFRVICDLDELTDN